MSSINFSDGNLAAHDQIADGVRNSFFLYTHTWNSRTEAFPVSRFLIQYLCISLVSGPGDPMLLEELCIDRDILWNHVNADNVAWNWRSGESTWNKLGTHDTSTTVATPPPPPAAPAALDGWKYD